MSLGDHRWVLVCVALLEISIGLAFLLNRYVVVAALLMVGHLTVATVSVLVTQGFTSFPTLSVAGEFVVKNLVLVAAGLVLIQAQLGNRRWTLNSIFRS